MLPVSSTAGRGVQEYDGHAVAAAVAEPEANAGEIGVGLTSGRRAGA